MLNKVILIGRLTADPELRYTGNGVAYTKFNLAVERAYKNQNGEKEVDFIRIIVWKKMAEVCANNLGKGRLVAIEGRLQVQNYEKDGEKRISTDVVAENVRFLDWPKDGKKSGNNAPTEKDVEDVFGSGSISSGDFDFPSDDLPF